MGYTGKDPMEWARETQARLLAVHRTSVDMLADEMRRTRANGGRLPHLTGNLMRSMLASTTGPIPMGKAGQVYTGGDVGLVVAGMAMDDTIWIGYQANYAHRLNYGFVGQDSLGRNYKQGGAHFVEAAANEWPAIVERAAAEVFRKVTSRG